MNIKWHSTCAVSQIPSVHFPKIPLQQIQPNQTHRLTLPWSPMPGSMPRAYFSQNNIFSGIVVLRNKFKIRIYILVRFVSLRFFKSDRETDIARRGLRSDFNDQTEWQKALFFVVVVVAVVIIVAVLVVVIVVAVVVVAVVAVVAVVIIVAILVVVVVVAFVVIAVVDVAVVNVAVVANVAFATVAVVVKSAKHGCSCGWIVLMGPQVHSK